MSLSRKRRKELKKLKKLTAQLADEQRLVLGHAGSVLGEAGYQARKLGDELVKPRVADAYSKVRPSVEASADFARGVGASVRRAATPVAASALARTISALEKTDNKEAAKRLKRFAKDQGFVKRRRGVFGTIALVLGGLVAAAVGYSLWQAFSEDEELWVAPEGE